MALTSLMSSLVSCPLHPAHWSIFNVEPLPKDAEPLHQSLSEMYYDAMTDVQFQRVFVAGCVIVYVLDVIGCRLYDNITASSSNHKLKLQREQFAGQFISIIHAFMISLASTVFISYYEASDAFNASPDDLLVLIYKCCCTLSAAYFFMDSVFIAAYYKQSFSKTIAFIVHHFSVGMCMTSVQFLPTAICYYAALNFVIEWSTVMLTMRVFAKVASSRFLFWISGWAILISYPFFRIVYMAALIYISFNSHHLKYFSTHYGHLVLGWAQVFVCLLSSYYYFAIIMAKPKEMYTLKKSNVQQKNC